MDKITESVLEDAMKFVFDQKIKDLLSGKYEPPNMIDKAVSDICNSWSELLKTAIEIK